MTNLERWLGWVVQGKPFKRRPRRKQRRGPERNAARLAFVRRMECCCGCGRGPCEAAHTGTDGGMSMKAADRSTVPLFRECHRLYHQIGKAEFERRFGICFVSVVRAINEEWDAERRAA